MLILPVNYSTDQKAITMAPKYLEQSMDIFICCPSASVHMEITPYLCLLGSFISIIFLNFIYFQSV